MKANLFFSYGKVIDSDKIISEIIGRFHISYSGLVRTLFSLCYCSSSIDIGDLSKKFYSITDQFELFRYVGDIISAHGCHDYYHTEWPLLEWRCRLAARVRHDLTTGRIGRATLIDDAGRKFFKYNVTTNTIYSRHSADMILYAEHIKHLINDISLTRQDIFLFLKTINPNWNDRAIHLTEEYDEIKLFIESIEKEIFVYSDDFGK